MSKESPAKTRRVQSVRDAQVSPQIVRKTLLFPGRLKALRQQQGMTQENLMKELNISKPTLISYEKGTVKNPSLTVLLGIQSVLGIGSIEELLGPPESPSGELGLIARSKLRRQGAGRGE